MTELLAICQKYDVSMSKRISVYAKPGADGTEGSVQPKYIEPEDTVDHLMSEVSVWPKSLADIDEWLQAVREEKWGSEDYKQQRIKEMLERRVLFAGP